MAFAYVFNAYSVAFGGFLKEGFKMTGFEIVQVFTSG
jgi:hypothetical protein